MRQKILVILFACVFFSCTQNNTSEKELELQKKELELKQKEAELNERELAMNAVPEAPPKPAPIPLSVTPLNVDGTFGQITFSQNEKTVFYYDTDSKKGKIKINDKEYTLDKYALNSDGTYNLSGNAIKIVAPNCKYDEDAGGDCSYGKFSVVTITVGN